MIHRIVPAALLAASLGFATTQSLTGQPYQQADSPAAKQANKPILIFVEAP